MKTQFEKRLIIRMKRLAKKKYFREQVWKEQNEAIKKNPEVKEAMREYIKDSGNITMKEKAKNDKNIQKGS